LKYAILAWDGVYRENHKDYFRDRKYPTLLCYFCDEIGASTEKNVCAIAVDLAALNNMTMAELFQKYQG
jgi:hypothetical protein